MNQFSQHNEQLKNLFSVITSVGKLPDNSTSSDFSEIDSTLRKLVDIKDMRKAGSFFTGDNLASNIAQGFTKTFDENSKIIDPTCGTGNLLITASRSLKVEKNLSTTLRVWNNTLIGFDIYAHFIECTKIRLTLQAIYRGATIDCKLNECINLLSNIKCKNALDINSENIDKATHIYMNPPFSTWSHEGSDTLGKGTTNASAIIFSHFLKIAPIDCEFGAILPEVLRSGTRYKKWRDFVEKNISGRIELLGQFDKDTDIDVFSLHGKKCKTNKKIHWFDTFNDKETTVSDSFDVFIGPLVAYRDLEQGEEYPYIHAKNTPSWATIFEFNEHRRFSKKVVKPPFVAIRRTSRPNDKYRAVGSIVCGNRSVAVENHLIVAKPKNNRLSECENLIKALKSSKTNDFLNNRIRCRHLTIGSIKDLPYK